MTRKGKCNQCFLSKSEHTFKIHMCTCSQNRESKSTMYGKHDGKRTHWRLIIKMAFSLFWHRWKYVWGKYICQCFMTH